MAQLENGRTQNQLLVGLAQKSGLFLQDSGQHEGTQVNGKTSPTEHYISLLRYCSEAMPLPSRQVWSLLLQLFC